VTVDEKAAPKVSARVVRRVALLGEERAVLRVAQRGWSAGP